MVRARIGERIGERINDIDANEMSCHFNSIPRCLGSRIILVKKMKLILSQLHTILVSKEQFIEKILSWANIDDKLPQ